MNAIYGAIEIAASFIEMFLLYKIYEHAIWNVRKVHGKRKDILFAIIGTILIYLCNQVSMFSYFTILIFVIYTSFSACFLYKASYVVLFSVSSFYILCVSSFDFLIFTFISNLGDGFQTFLSLIMEQGPVRCALIMTIKTIWILVYLFTRKYLYRISEKRNHIAAVLCISCMGFAGFVFLVNQTFKAFHYSIIGSWFIFLAFFAFVIFAVYFILEYRGEKMKSSFLEMKNKVLEEKYQEINKIYTSHARIYHDLNNHLNVLHQLIEKEDYDTAKKYISEINGPITRLSIKQWTGIEVIDVILNSKLDIMNEKGIQAVINVEYPSDSCIQANDICTVLSNMLDNAIEATEKTVLSVPIALTIRKINDYLLIKVTNPSLPYDKSMNELVTSKKDKMMHGWGLINIKDTVEKYEGTFKLKYDNGIFSATAMMLYTVDKK